MTHCDVAFVIDHLNANCGVRIRYTHVLRRCSELGLRVGVIGDGRPEDVPSSIGPWLTLRVRDQNDDANLKRRPFCAVADLLEDETFRECGIARTALWLDAWRGSTDWIPSVVQEIDRFMMKTRPRRVFIATQSFLGFAAASTLRPRSAASAFHTDYAAFYAARLAGASTGPLFTRIREACDRRIATEFFPAINVGFVSSSPGVAAHTPALKELDVVHEFPGGVDWNLFGAGGPRKEHGGRLRILFVGRLSEEKGVRLLADAASELGEHAWTVIGEGPLQPLLSRALPTATFLPYLPQTQLASRMREADVLVFLGRFDTFGITVLEALASGLAVVVLEGSGIASLVQRSAAGLVIPPDPAAVIEAVARLASSMTLRRDLAQRGHELARTLSWDAVCNKMLDQLGVRS